MVGSATTSCKLSKTVATLLTENELNGLTQALNEDQKKLLIEIKQIFADKIAGNEKLFDDLFFVRFLRARAFDIKKTTLMLDKYFSWRLEQEIDRLLETDMSHIRDTVRLYYPHGYHGIDKLGRPIYLERLGQAHVSKVLQNVTTEELTRYYIQRYEYLIHVMMPAASLYTGKCVEQLLTIVDLKGISITQVNQKLKAFLDTISAVSQNYYPELMGRFLFINSSTLFSALWSIFSKLLDPKTIEKVSVISSKTESRNRVLELVDADQLPEFLGGTRSDEDWQTCTFGPWGDESIKSRLQELYPHIPSFLYNLKQM